MARPATTKTIGPLHLEDLEPHRFEDLIRQLLYDFRDWQQLEPTGRTGSDGGFDVLAREKAIQEERNPENDDGDEEDDLIQADVSRIWLVQCKRERTIAPKKLAKYIAQMPKDQNLSGIIFAAACDFSKASRDLFREATRALGVSEAYLWGKAEIEDMLFQPKNDHLLFAYFGFSLQTRRRSLKTHVRAKLAVKRKVLKYLNQDDLILIRDSSDERYPQLDLDKSKQRDERGRWAVFRYRDVRHDGLHFVIKRHFAFLDEDGCHWDFAEEMNDAKRSGYEEPRPGHIEKVLVALIWIAQCNPRPHVRC